MTVDGSASGFPVDLSSLRALIRRIDDPEPVSTAQIEHFAADADSHLLEHSSSLPPEELETWRAGLAFLDGVIEYAFGNVETAGARFSASVEHSRSVGDVALQVRALRRAALCHEYGGRQTDAIDAVLEALSLAESTDDPNILITALSGLLALYESQGAYEAALDVVMRIRRLAEGLGDELHLARACSYAALFCGYLGRPEEGLRWLEQCLAYCEAGEHTMIERYSRLYGFWLLHVAGRSDDAVEAAEQQLDVIASLPAQNAAATYVDVAEAHLAVGNFSRAEEMLGLAAERAGSELRGHLIRYYEVAANLHEARGETAIALRMLRRHTELLDELRGRQARARLITVERRFAAELAQKSAEIHHLRNIELVDKNEQLAAADRQKDEILRVVAHDLRSPVAAVTMLSEIALLDHAGTGDTSLTEQLHAMRTASAEMGETIDQLLHLRGPDGPPLGAAVDVVVAKSVDWVRPLAEERSVSVVEHISTIDMVVEEALLRRTVDDVLWVMTQCTEAGEHLEVRSKPHDDGSASIVVTGPAKVSEQAQRTLYIGRRLVERMGGSLTIDVRPIEHCSVTIQLRCSADVRGTGSPADQPSVTQP